MRWRLIEYRLDLGFQLNCFELFTGFLSWSFMFFLFFSSRLYDGLLLTLQFEKFGLQTPNCYRVHDRLSIRCTLSCLHFFSLDKLYAISTLKHLWWPLLSALLSLFLLSYALSRGNLYFLHCVPYVEWEFDWLDCQVVNICDWLSYHTKVSIFWSWNLSFTPCLLPQMYLYVKN